MHWPPPAPIQTTDAGVANLYHVEMSSSSSAGTVYDLDNSGTSLSVYDCAYSPSKTTGTLGGQNVPGNGFSGPCSVTLIFHDAGGTVVPGVVFTVVGVGAAVADGRRLQNRRAARGNIHHPCRSDGRHALGRHPDHRHDHSHLQPHRHGHHDPRQPIRRKQRLISPQETARAIRSR